MARRATAARRVAASPTEIAAVEADLGGQGRVLVRPSGTEPLVRVMVEAAEPAVQAGADRLVPRSSRLAGRRRLTAPQTGPTCPGASGPVPDG